MSISTVSKVIVRTIEFICSLGPSLIKWPDEETKKASSEFLMEHKGFPNVIGAIDVTHIVIDPPSSRKDDYIDRKGDIILKLQAICNEKKKFISIFVGYPGSCHDSWVFQNSFIYQELKNRCGNYYILGDSAYPCIFTKNFNIKLSSWRVMIGMEGNIEIDLLESHQQENNLRKEIRNKICEYLNQ